MTDEPGTSRSSPPPATEVTPLSEAAVRGLIREEVAAAITAALSSPPPLPSTGELHVGLAPSNNSACMYHATPGTLSLIHLMLPFSVAQLLQPAFFFCGS